MVKQDKTFKVALPSEYIDGDEEYNFVFRNPKLKELMALSDSAVDVDPDDPEAVAEESGVDVETVLDLIIDLYKGLKEDSGNYVVGFEEFDELSTDIQLYILEVVSDKLTEQFTNEKKG